WGRARSSSYHILPGNHVLVERAGIRDPRSGILLGLARSCIHVAAPHQNEKSNAKESKAKDMGGEHAGRSELVRCHCADGRLVDDARFLASHRSWQISRLGGPVEPRA